MKTIRQIADELGVSKQRVYRCIKANHINEAHRDRDTMYYDETAESLIKSHFASVHLNHDANQSTLNDTETNAVTYALVELLQHELEAKNKQIETQAAQISDLTAALVAAQQTATAAQALHAGTIKKHLEDPEAKQRDRGFFSRIFGKRGE